MSGGTLGMDGKRPTPLHPSSYLRNLVQVMPEIGEIATIDTEILFNLDSSNIGPPHWSLLADRIGQSIRSSSPPDGIVIIHGTDTMAYTASALSFMLPGIDRPVVLTGSQRPLKEIRSDARQNLLNAVELATLNIPEVTVCFGSRLFRGNRVTKVDSWRYGAFESPGMAPLAELGVTVDITAQIRYPNEPFRVVSRVDPRVMVTWVTPGMNPQAIAAGVRAADVRGLVVAAFGSGNLTTEPPNTLNVLRTLVDDGVTVMVTSQTLRGGVDLTLYDCGAALLHLGALSAGDMTLEATVTKLMWALANSETPLAVGSVMQQNLAGEMTPDAHSSMA